MTNTKIKQQKKKYFKLIKFNTYIFSLKKYQVYPNTVTEG